MKRLKTAFLGLLTVLILSGIAKAQVSGGAISIDYSQQRYLIVTATADVSFAAPTNPNTKGVLTLMIVQDNVGSHPVTWNAIFVFNTAWTNLNNDAGKRTMVRFRWDGAHWNQEGTQVRYH